MQVLANNIVAASTANEQAAQEQIKQVHVFDGLPYALVKTLRNLEDLSREGFASVVAGVSQLIRELNQKGISTHTLCNPEFKIKFNYDVRGTTQQIDGFYTLLKQLTRHYYRETPGTLLEEALGRAKNQVERRSYYAPSLWTSAWPEYSNREQLLNTCREIFAFRDFQFREFCQSCFFAIEEPQNLASYAPRVYSGFDLLAGLYKLDHPKAGFLDLRSAEIKKEYYQLRETLGLGEPDTTDLRIADQFNYKFSCLVADANSKYAIDGITTEAKATIETEPDKFDQHSIVGNSQKTYYIDDLSYKEPSKINSAKKFNPQDFPDDYPLHNIFRNIRPAAAGDQYIILESLDELNPKVLPEVKKIARQKKLENVEQEYIDVLNEQKVLGEATTAWSVIGEFLNKVSPPDQTIYTCSYPDLKLANSKGEIVFESIAHLMATEYHCCLYVEKQYVDFCKLNDMPVETKQYGLFAPAEEILSIQYSSGYISNHRQNKCIQLIQTSDYIADLHVPYDLKDPDFFRANLISACKQWFGGIPDSFPSDQQHPFYHLLLVSSTDNYDKQASFLSVAELIDKIEPDLFKDQSFTDLAELLRLPPVHSCLKEKDASKYFQWVKEYPSLRMLFFPERVSKLEGIEVDEAPLMFSIGQNNRTKFEEHIHELIKDAIEPHVNESYSNPREIFTRMYEEGPVLDMHGELLLARNFPHFLKQCEDLLYLTGLPLRGKKTESIWGKLFIRALPRVTTPETSIFRADMKYIQHLIFTDSDFSSLKPEDIPQKSLKALNELSLQVTGEPYQAKYRKHIEKLKITHVNGGPLVTGLELIKQAELDNIAVIESKPKATQPLNTTVTQAPVAPPVSKPNLYQHLFEDLSVPTGTVFLALCAIGELKETRSGLAKFKGLLKVAEEKGESKHTKQGTLKTFADFIDLHSKANPKVDLSHVGLQRFKDFFYQVCYRENDGDLSKIQAELEGYITSDLTKLTKNKTTQEILGLVIPDILRSINDTLNFKVPDGLNFTPFPYQIDASCSALYQNRKLVVLGPGTGKTNTGILLGFAGEFKKVLWLTKASNRADTVQNINESAKVKALDLNATVLKADQKSLAKLIDEHNVLVASYDTLWRVAENNPETIALLNQHLQNGLKILDEGHLLDNMQSKRTTGVRAIHAQSTVVLTATPVQHKVEKVATLLHLTLPELYPDGQILERQFKADKSLARALYHQHSTVYSVEDVALPFDDLTRTPASTQLEHNVPRVPNLITHTKSFNLSMEHSWLYLKLVSDYKNWCEETGQTDGKLRQFARIKKLLVNPETLDTAPPLALLDAIKGIALPHMQQGEKVLILGQSLHPLQLLAKDPELAQFKTAFLSGAQSPLERSKAIKDFEQDPNFLCTIGQVQAVGTGYNFRGISHLIIVDNPSTNSELIQAMGRHRRILSSSTAKFALENVRVWFLNPRLDESVSKSIADTKLGTLLQSGNIYNHRHQKTLAQIQDYRLLTSRSHLASIESNTSVTELVAELDSLHAALEQSRVDFDTLRANCLSEHFYRYGNSNKLTWRHELEKFVTQNIELLGKHVTEQRVALLPGPQALEVPVYLSQAIKPENVLCFEADPDHNVQSFCRQEVGKLGARYYSTRIEKVLPKLEQPVDILSLDSNGYLTEDLFKMLLELKIDGRLMLLKNMLCGRERDQAAVLLEGANGDRELLDGFMLNLVGSNFHINHQLDSPSALLEKLDKIRQAAMTLAIQLEVLLPEHSTDKLAKVIQAITCHSPKVINQQIYRYQSPKGSPFLSRFAVLEKVPDKIADSDTANLIRKSCLLLAEKDLVNREQVIKKLSRRQVNEIIGIIDYYCF